jgi:hypothetical protein
MNRSFQKTTRRPLNNFAFLNSIIPLSSYFHSKNVHSYHIQFLVMKKIYLAGLIFTLFASWIVLSSSSGGRATAANTGNTGAPGETATCTSCHGGGNYGTISVSIQAFDLGTANVAATYSGGTQYDMRVTVNHTAGTPSGYGFQLLALKQTSNTPVAGYSNLGTNVKQKAVTSGAYSGRTYLEHNGVSASNQFNFRWTAPVSGTGTVVFYSAGNCVNTNGGDNGDKAGNSSFTFSEAVAALSVSGTAANVSCNTASTGSITLNPAGGTPAYTYKWSDGPTTKDRANIPAGSYSVTVTDAASATAAASFTISEPAALVATNTATGILCNGGNATVTVSASGGTPPYTGTGAFSRVAGNYSFTVTDAKGCTAATAVSLSEPTKLLLSIPGDTIGCVGDSTSIFITAVNGTPPYTGDGAVTITTPGSYSFTVTDANGCSEMGTTYIASPTDLDITADVTSVICHSVCNGRIEVAVTGGLPPFAYKWSTGDTTKNLTGLCAGVYEQSVTDANGCKAVITSFLGEPDSLYVSGTAVTNAVNNDGAVDITITGGDAPYTCSWSNGDTTQDIDSLVAGAYTVTITDANGCSIQSSATVAGQQPNSIAALQLQRLSLFPNPAGSSITVDLSNSIDGAILEVLGITGNNLLKQHFPGINSRFTIDISQLPASVYCVRVTSATATGIKQFIKQ